MKVSEPWVKMKLAVHWAPAVKVCTPGWMGADAAGAHASAAEAGMTKEANAARHSAADARRGKRLSMCQVFHFPHVTHASLGGKVTLSGEMLGPERVFVQVGRLRPPKTVRPPEDDAGMARQLALLDTPPEWHLTEE